jgi:hypothetical protein
MILRALKALAPGAIVLFLLTTCGAQEPTGQAHNVMTQLSESFQRVVTKVAAATVTLDVVAYVPPDDDDDNSSSSSMIASSYRRPIQSARAPLSIRTVT